MPKYKGPSVTEQWCNEVLSKLTDTQEITEQEIVELAIRWCKKDYDHHRSFGLKHNLPPIALIIVALLWIEHPLLVTPGRGMLFNIERAAAEIIRCELLRLDLPIPAEINPQMQPVERTGEIGRDQAEKADLLYIPNQPVERF